MSLKNPVTPPGIDPGTARLVTQRLNHYTTPGYVLKKMALNIVLLESDVLKFFDRPVRNFGTNMGNYRRETVRKTRWFSHRRKTSRS